MENQKLENLLNLALEATPRERELSENLQIGYNPEEQTWELIVKHSEPLPDLTEMGDGSRDSAASEQLCDYHCPGIPD